MLPRTNDFVNPDVDYESAWGRLTLLTKSFGHNGMRLCIDNTPKGYFNLVDYDVKRSVRKHMAKFYKSFEEMLNGNDVGKVLRSALFICLVGYHTEHLEIKQALI